MSELIRVAPMQPVGNHVTNSSLSSAIVVPVPEGATGILVQAISQNIRFKLDGNNPTTGSGFQLRAGDPPELIPAIPGRNVRFIQEAATATLEYQAVAQRGGTP